MHLLQYDIEQLPFHEPHFWKDVSMSDPVMEIRIQESTAVDKVALHSHPFYEILFVTSGNNINYLLGGQRYRLQNGDIVLIPPGMSHSPLFLENLTEPYKRIVLWFDAGKLELQAEQNPELLFAFSQCRKKDSYVLRSSPATSNGLLAAFYMLFTETQQKRFGWQYSAHLTSFMLMVHISRTYYYQDTAFHFAEQDCLFDDIFKYIDANLANRITLQETAHHFLVSTSTISHLFQKRLGISFYQCVIQRRLICSKNNILSGMPLSVVWEACGFSDYTSFYRLFRKEYAMSPSQFRAAKKQQHSPQIRNTSLQIP